MLRSMFSAVSGLRNHQMRMDVIGNNIANVNTVGFKASRVTFKDVFSQTIRGASSAQVKDGSPVIGGMNPMQIGLGMSLGTIDVIYGRSSIETTGKNTDLAIDGDGYFKLRIGNSDQHFYTRAGNFDVMEIGDMSYLVHAGTGYKVVGKDNTDIAIPMGAVDPAKATTAAVVEGNLNSSAGFPYKVTPSATTPGDFDYELLPQYSTTLEVIDSLGEKHVLTLEYRLNAQNESGNAMTATGTVTDVTQLDKLRADPDLGWTCTVKANGTTAGIASGATFNLKFKPDGTIDNASTISQDIVIDVKNSQADDIKVKLDLAKVIQQSGDFTVAASRSDGYSMGSMDSFSIDVNGNVIGNFTNGQNRVLGQISLARFLNPGGLIKVGDNLFQESNSSGQAISGFPNEGGFGKIAPSSLEMSNVDLSQEFTNMITTQRGFQANSRVITTSDEILQELVNLKR